MSVILNGNWNLIIDSPFGEQEGELSLTNTDGSLQGMITSKIGRSEVTGSADGSKIYLNAVVNWPMGTIELTITGTIDGQFASGSIQAGTFGTWPWRGNLTEPPEDDNGGNTNLIESDKDDSAQPESVPADGKRLVSSADVSEDSKEGRYVPVGAVKRTFASLGEPSFRNLWVGGLLQMGGMQMLMVAGGYYIYEITGSASLLGFVTAAAAIPVLLLALFGGVIADRLEKKRIIQAGQSVSVLIALFIAISIVTDTITWVHFLVVSLVQGSVLPLMMPARQAIIPQLVGADRMMNAVALNAMGISLTTMLAPGIAGGLIAVLGIESVYFIIAGMYGGAVLFTGLLPKIEVQARSASSTVVREIKDGFKYVLANRAIAMLLVLSFSTMILAMPIRFILPIFAKDVFLVGPEGLGYMMSAIGVGALGGTLFIASLGTVSRRGLALALSGVVSGAVLLGFAALSYFSPIYLWSLAFMVVVGMLQAGRMTLNGSLIMEYAEQEYRGRVMSILTLSMGIMPAAVVPVTLMADRVGAPVALGIMAVLLIFVASFILVSSPRLRELR